MTDEEVAVKLEGHEHEIGSLKHRMAEQEEQSKVIQDLVLSVKELALNMKNMIEVQAKQSEDIEMLKAEPAKRWNDSKKALFNAILGAIGAALGAGIIYIAAQFL